MKEESKELTLGDFKDQVAKEDRYDNWNHYFLTANKWDVVAVLNKSAELYAQSRFEQGKQKGEEKGINKESELREQGYKLGYAVGFAKGTSKVFTEAERKGWNAALHWVAEHAEAYIGLNRSGGGFEEPLVSKQSILNGLKREEE